MGKRLSDEERSLLESLLASDDEEDEGEEEEDEGEEEEDEGEEEEDGDGEEGEDDDDVVIIQGRRYRAEPVKKTPAKKVAAKKTPAKKVAAKKTPAKKVAKRIVKADPEPPKRRRFGAGM